MHARLIFVLTLCLLATGCTSTLIDPPPGYIRTKYPYHYNAKYVSSTGHVMAVTARPNEDTTADLAFWSGALEHQKVTVEGMKLANRESIKTNSGQPGELFQFENPQDPTNTTYLVALFVKGRQIQTIEAGARGGFEKDELESIKKSMQTLR